MEPAAGAGALAISDTPEDVVSGVLCAALFVALLASSVVVAGPAGERVFLLLFAIACAIAARASLSSSFVVVRAEAIEVVDRRWPLAPRRTTIRRDRVREIVVKALPRTRRVDRYAVLVATAEDHVRVGRAGSWDDRDAFAERLRSAIGA